MKKALFLLIVPIGLLHRATAIANRTDRPAWRIGTDFVGLEIGMLVHLPGLQIEKFFVTRVKGFEPQKMVACTLVFEGMRQEVEQQERDLYRIAARHKGMKAGSENGRRGYQLTYSIAYIRDFLMSYYIIAESFETSVPWTQALKLCENVKQRLLNEYQQRKLPGKPFVTARITQLYRTGVCIYFYFGFYF